MRRIAIINHVTHDLFIEDVDEKELEEKYNGDEQSYIDDSYELDGDYSWDWITDITYFPKEDKTPIDVEPTEWL